MPRPFSPAVAAIALLVAACTSARAQSTELLPNGGFDQGGAGWTVVGATASYEGSAAHLTASPGGGAMALVSQYWLSPTVPGADHSFAVSVLDDDPNIEGVTAQLELLDAGGVRLLSASAALSGDSPSYRPLSVGLTAPPGSAGAETVTLRGPG